MFGASDESAVRGGADDRTIDPLGLFRLDGKVVVVTGASSGLGERMARVFHAVGATVVATARRVERLDALVDTLPGAIALPADVSDSDQRERLVREVIERCGGVDVLVNNAGIATVVRVEDESIETFRESMEINVTAVWHLSKLCAPSMISRGGGSIVNVASMLGHVAATPVKQANYCASKGAVVNLTRELAIQWARKGVRVNALVPGLVPVRDDGRHAVGGLAALHRAVLGNPENGRGARARRGGSAARERCRLLHHRSQPARRRWLDRSLSPATVTTYRCGQGCAASSWLATRMSTSSRPYAATS